LNLGASACAAIVSTAAMIPAAMRIMPSLSGRPGPS
jgi:hypothetical protein